MSAAFSRCLWGRNEWVTNKPQRTSNLEPLCQQYTCVWPHRVRKWCFQACSVLGILNKGIVLNNSNNGNVMASRSVHGYHAHFRIQDREKGKWSNGLLVVRFGSWFWKVLSVLGIKSGWTWAAGDYPSWNCSWVSAWSWSWGKTHSPYIRSFHHGSVSHNSLLHCLRTLWLDFRLSHL